MKEIKILCTAHTATHGTLTTGRVLSVEAAFAKHLVEECGAAEYTAEKKVASPKGEVKPASPGGSHKMAAPKGKTKPAPLDVDSKPPEPAIDNKADTSTEAAPNPGGESNSDTGA